jgi:hypothetical protein
MPCSGHCYESSSPELCLGLEVCCCFSNSVMSTRMLLQDDLRIMNSKCDNCLMAFTFALQQLACICDIIALFDRSYVLSTHPPLSPSRPRSLRLTLRAAAVVQLRGSGEPHRQYRGSRVVLRVRVHAGASPPPGQCWAGGNTALH